MEGFNDMEEFDLGENLFPNEDLIQKSDLHELSGEQHFDNTKSRMAFNINGVLFSIVPTEDGVVIHSSEAIVELLKDHDGVRLYKPNTNMLRNAMNAPVKRIKSVTRISYSGYPEQIIVTDDNDVRIPSLSRTQLKKIVELSDDNTEWYGDMPAGAKGKKI